MTITMNNYNWEVVFVNKDDSRLGQCNDGLCKYNEMTIYVSDDLPTVVKREVLIHELTHAYLCTQGRCYQKKFDLEEVCEFVGFCGANIIEIAYALIPLEHKEVQFPIDGGVKEFKI